MFRKLIHTSDDYTLTLLRAALGIVFFAHGAQKVPGWFGGGGWSNSMDYFTQTLGIPGLLAVLAILAEFLGGLCLILGFLTRVVALGIAIDMAVALFLVHLPNGFFMNWSGNQKGEGFEFHVLAISIAIALMARGGGAMSFDRILDNWVAAGRYIHIARPQPSRG